MFKCDIAIVNQRPKRLYRHLSKNGVIKFIHQRARIKILIQNVKVFIRVRMLSKDQSFHTNDDRRTLILSELLTET